MPLETIQSFHVRRLGVLDEEGRVDPDVDPGLDDATLLALARSMLLSRAADERMFKLQRQGRLGTFPPGIGQEAASVGAAAAMADQDWLVPAFRDMGALLERGYSLESYLRLYNGWEEGNLVPEGCRILPSAIVVASSTLHAVGLAWGLRHKGESDTAVLSFIGDGGTSEGDFYEALNFAGVWNVPVVFVIQNNQWAISMPRAAQTRAASLAQKAISAGIPGLQVDGNDVLAVYRATRQALQRAREGDGPSLIEAVTYRLMMHTTADDPKKYRDPEEEKAAWEREPLIRTRLYLSQKGIWDDKKEAAQQQELREEVAAAVKNYEEIAAGEFKPDTAFDHLYGTDVPEVEAQRAAFLARGATREG